MLHTAQPVATCRQTVTDAMHNGGEIISEAHQILQGMTIGADVPPAEQRSRRWKKQKLAEDLIEAAQALEAARSEFEDGAVVREQRLAEEAKRLAELPPAAATRPVDGDLEAPDAESERLARLQLQQQQIAEDRATDVHIQHARETADAVAETTQNILALQRSLGQLADHVQEQGAVLDTIEANLVNAEGFTADATQELLQTDQRHRKTTTRMGCLLSWLVLISCATLLVALIRGGFH